MVWRLGFAQTRWGAYNAPQNPLAGFRRPTSNGKREGKNCREGKGDVG